MTRLTKNLNLQATIQTSYGVLVLGILGSVQGQRNPSITKTSYGQTKNIGETAELVCGVDAVQDYPVLWEKLRNLEKDSVAISTRTTNIINDDRFSTKFDTVSSSYILEIRHLQEIDDGLYRCEIPISTNQILQADVVELKIRRPPIIYDNSTLSEVVFEGQRVNLRCYAHGYPEPEIWWRRPDNGILPTGRPFHKGNTLEFKSVRREDCGTYYCSASNGYHKSVRRRISLEVRPLISLVELRNSAEYRDSGDIKLYEKQFECPAWNS
ncbi:hypothetical protein QAD02_000351 [Eretmocerus hayati]|uniref:Uncharacterized protein n=1 Tax=Eretmocerus hayati TaxID=131215 RepID=A0ACC2ND79_9HYME|nr:hypothetical protein QAD02_000351 [Eretmocerus hayati]